MKLVVWSEVMSREFARIREQFIEQIGLVAQGEGMPRIAGRLMGLMVFDGKPRSFGELATELKVSRGSISTNARMLEERGIIERLGIAGDRQDYFPLAENAVAECRRTGSQSRDTDWPHRRRPARRSGGHHCAHSSLTKFL